MPASSLVPKNGAVAIGTATADYNSFDIESKQVVEGVTPYGANVCSKNVANGTPDFTVNVGAAALAHATTTPAALPALSTGAASTFTLDTGVTESGTFVVESIKISHGRMKAAVPMAIAMKNGGDVTEAWATS